MLLLYYRSYVTQEFIGWILGLDDAHVCRTLRKREPLLAKVRMLPQRQELSKEDGKALLLDVTESPL